MDSDGNRHVSHTKKTFLVHLDLERAATKKADQLARGLSPERREAFFRIVDDLRDSIIWERFREHVILSLESPTPGRADLNVYELQRSMTKVLKHANNWVRRNQTFGGEKMLEFRRQITLSAKSICDFIDGTATCWKLRKLVELRRGD